MLDSKTVFTHVSFDELHQILWPRKNGPSRVIAHDNSVFVEKHHRRCDVFTFCVGQNNWKTIGSHVCSERKCGSQINANRSQ